jgi:hypothetical protein
MERERVLGLAVLHDPSALGIKVTLEYVQHPSEEVGIQH